jgi:SAM-dependent methyltransferase
MASDNHGPGKTCAWIQTENAFGYHIDALAFPELSFIQHMIDMAKHNQRANGDRNVATSPAGGVVPAETASRLRVADLGCGQGYTTESMLRKFRTGAAFEGVLGKDTVEFSSELRKEDSISPSGVEIDVIAADLDEKHLKALEARLSDVDKRRLTTMAGDCTALPFPSGHLNGILACRWVHFLDGPQLRAFFRTATEWLAPGGILCLTAESPRLGTTKDTFLPEYEHKKAEGEEWPGIRVLPSDYLFKKLPPFLHLLDPSILTREATIAGLEIIDCDYLARPYYPPGLVFDNKESTFLLARKPNTS